MTSTQATRTRSARLKAVQHIAETVAGPAAAEVDRDARFPHEVFDALRNERLLAAFVPSELGGLDCDIAELAAMCGLLGQYCAASALIFAMHQIQVACIVRHGLSSEYFRDYLRR
jgi:acyl-CoA dehydrogenase